MSSLLTFPVLRSTHFMYPAAMFRTEERPEHGGLDFTPIIVGEPEPMVAVEDGEVVISGYSFSAGHNIMVLGATTGIRWWYGHASKRAVVYGQKVKRGQYLGMTGNTGNVKGFGGKLPGCHLHLEAHRPTINVEVDPWPLLFNAPDANGSIAKLATTRDEAERWKASGTAVPSAPIVENDEEGFLMALSNDKQERMYAQIEAIRAGQIVEGAGYTYDAAILGLVQGLYPALSRVAAAIGDQAQPEVQVDVEALAALVTENLGDVVAKELGERLLQKPGV